MLCCLLTYAYTHSISVDDITDFLKIQKLDPYTNVFRDNGIDGDILSAIIEKEVKVADIILKEELGMKKAVERAKVKANFGDFVDSLASVQSGI